MKKNSKYYWGIGIVIMVAIISLLVYVSRLPGKYDGFARCIKDSGAKFYGAFWCSHCQTQKRAFGKSAKYLPYVECSTPDGQGQLSECSESGVQSHPTWQYPDGTRESGEITFERLAEKTSCVLPKD